MRFVAIDILQVLELRRGLDAFRDDFQSQALPERDHRAGDRGGGIRGIDFGDERSVDLDPVDRQLTQIAQRRIAGAKVVDRQTYADIVELIEHVDRIAHIVHNGGLGNLELELFGIIANVVENLAD